MRNYKKLLQIGNFVKLRNNTIGLISEYRIITSQLWINLNGYDDTLSHRADSKYDIINIYKIKDLVPGFIDKYRGEIVEIYPEHHFWYKYVSEALQNNFIPSVIHCIYSRDNIIVDIF